MLLLTKLEAEDVTALLSLAPALPPFPPLLLGTAEALPALPVKAFKCDHFGEPVPVSGSEK